MSADIFNIRSYIEVGDGHFERLINRSYLLTDFDNMNFYLNLLRAAHSNLKNYIALRKNLMFFKMMYRTILV